MLNIPGFPHAYYNPKEKAGFLAYYYPNKAVKDGNLDEGV